MAYRQEKVELGIWPVFAFLTNPAFWAGVGKVATAAASAAVVSSMAPPGAGGVARPESSLGPLFTQQVDVQQRIDEILGKGKAEEERIAAEAQAKKMAMVQPALWGLLIIVGGLAIWKITKKRKSK